VHLASKCKASNSILSTIRKGRKEGRKKGRKEGENITIINTYAPSVNATNVIKQTLLALNRQIAPDTIIVNNFNNCFHQ
jgi:hypothetical protein